MTSRSEQGRKEHSPTFIHTRSKCMICGLDGLRCIHCCRSLFARLAVRDQLSGTTSRVTYRQTNPRKCLPLEFQGILCTFKSTVQRECCIACLHLRYIRNAASIPNLRTGFQSHDSVAQFVEVPDEDQHQCQKVVQRCNKMSIVVAHLLSAPASTRPNPQTFFLPSLALPKMMIRASSNSSAKFSSNSSRGLDRTSKSQHTGFKVGGVLYQLTHS